MILSFTSCSLFGGRPAPGASASMMEPDIPNDLISEDHAIRIVLDRIEGAEASDITSFSLDNEYGRWQYEGELYFEGTEYRFEIDAQNGNILGWVIDDR
jgi:uncharacterized membrane protein YkoI